MWFPAYGIYEAAQTESAVAQISLSRERLEESVRSAVQFYDGVRAWKTNTAVTQLAFRDPIALTVTYDAETRTFTAEQWPEWAQGQLLQASNASFLLGTIEGNKASVECGGQIPSGTYTARLYECRKSLPEAKNIKMVILDSRAERLSPVGYHDLVRALSRLGTPAEPYYYFWDPLKKSILVIPQAGPTTISVIEQRSCMRGNAIGAMDEDFYGLVTASGTIVIGDGTQFDNYRHAGCLIYFSRDLAYPRASMEARRIVKVTSPLTLEIDRPLTVSTPSEYRITAAIETTQAGYELLKATACLDVASITGRGLQAAQRRFESAMRAAIREDSDLMSGTILDDRRIGQWTPP